MHLQFACRRFHPYADYAVSIDEEVGDLGLHPQIERRETPAALGQEVEEIPLGHECDELAPSRNRTEVGDAHALARDSSAELSYLSVREFQKVCEEPKLVHDL